MIKEITKYSVEVSDGKGGTKEVTFNSKGAAIAALAKVELAAKAQAYVDGLKDKKGAPLGDKDKVGKFNVVLAYLMHEAAVEAETEAPAGGETNAVIETEKF